MDSFCGQTKTGVLEYMCLFFVLDSESTCMWCVACMTTAMITHTHVHLGAILCVRVVHHAFDLLLKANQSFVA